MNEAATSSALIHSIAYVLVFLLGAAISAGAWWFYRRRSPLSNRLVHENLLIDIMMSIPESAILANKNGFIVFINPAAERLLRTQSRSARAKYHSELFHLLDPIKQVPINWLDAKQAGQQARFQPCLLNCTGLQDLETTFLVRSFSLEGGSADHFLLLLQDQAELVALQAHLAYLQKNDQHTRLMNRKAFEVALKVSLDEARQQGVKHAFCQLALDQFKAVNDTLGHSAGDAFIERIADLLKNAIDKKRDVLARIGGDEFGVLFREIEPVEALRKSEQLRHLIMSHEFVWDGQTHHITASVGFIPIQSQTGTTNRVMSIADTACRVAKSKGGNRLHVYRPDDPEISKHRGQVVWIGRLKQAFEQEQFQLYAQPIQPLEPKEFLRPFHHYEILLRLFDDSGKSISPDEFIPAAEYYSMMPMLDRWVVKKLLRAIAGIARKQSHLVFAINLSGQSLDDPQFLPYVQEAIKLSGVPPTMLCFEITERVAINNIELARKFIDTLKTQGCSFSLDDFGTGVSSFSYLKQLPVDYLKIDGSFIKDILTDDVGRAMVQSVNQIGQLMAVKTIAEYVETPQIIQLLREIGIDFGQGYGISKPIPLPQIIERHIEEQAGKVNKDGKMIGKDTKHTKDRAAA